MKLTPENDGLRHIDFPALWSRVLYVSAAAVAISLLALLVRGLDLGIDFQGGTSVEVRTEASIEEVTDLIPMVCAASHECRK